MRNTLKSLILVTSLLLSAAGADAQVRTIVVSPVPGNPVASGTALLNALDSITDAAFDNQYLIKLEPGKFDLNQGSLVMKPYVDIEGSGQHDTTRIVAKGKAAFNTGTVVGANNSELRDLMVVSLGSSQYTAAVAVYLQGVNTRISRVTAEAKNSIQGADGILVIGGAPTLTDVDAIATGSDFATGIALESATSAQLDRVSVAASGATNTNRAILVQGQTSLTRPTLRRVQISASGGQHALGINLRSAAGVLPPFDLIDSSVKVSGASIRNFGIHLEDGAISVTGSEVTAEGVLAHGIDSFGGTSLRIDRSTITGAVRSLFVQGSEDRVGASRLDGAIDAAALTCVASYDASYSDLICP